MISEYRDNGQPVKEEINHYEFQVTIVVAGETKEEAYDHLSDELQYLASLDNLVLAWCDEDEV